MSPIKVCEQGALTSPYLNPTLLQREELFFLVEEYEGFRWCKIRRLPRRLILTVYYLEWVATSLEHYALVELFKELDLSSSLVKANLHQDPARMDID